MGRSGAPKRAILAATYNRIELGNICGPRDQLCGRGLGIAGSGGPGVGVRENAGRCVGALDLGRKSSGLSKRIVSLRIVGSG